MPWNMQILSLEEKRKEGGTELLHYHTEGLEAASGGGTKV
jgi:hypothetical protein